MTTQPIQNTAWSDADLEAFHDGEAPDALRDALAADLLRDAALRERLQRIARADALVLDALTGAETAAPPRATGSCALRWPALAAALALVAVGVWSLMPGPAAAPLAAVPPAPAAEDAADALRAQARTIGVLLAAAPAGRDAAWTPVSPAPAHAPADPAGRFAQMLDEGRLAEAMALADVAAGPDRAAMWLAIGERLRSGDAAADALAAVPEAQQVEVCRAWLVNPSLRVVAFSRLGALSRSPDDRVRALVAELRDDLAQRPEFSAWLASYALR